MVSREIQREKPELESYVDAALGGDERAREKIVLCLMPRVRHMAHYLVRSPQDADDLAQQALVEVLRSLPGYRREGELEGWAQRVAARTMWVALGRIRGAELAMGDDLPDLPDPAARPGEDAERRELQQRLAGHLARLKPERRMVVMLKLACGYSIEEIAAMTDAPAETVRTRLRIGKAELRKRIERDPGLREMAEALS